MRSSRESRVDSRQSTVDGRESRVGHFLPLVLLGALSVVWTWPLAIHFRHHIPGLPGDNFSFLWNLWWMRRVLGNHALSFFHSTYLFSPFGVDLINHPHTALQGLISATVLSKLSIIEAENLYVVVSVFLNAASAYALAYDITRQRRLALVAGVAFGDSPYIAAHLLGHFDLLTAWVIPLFALCFRRALMPGPARLRAPATAGQKGPGLRGTGVMPAIGCGLCVTVAAYNAYYHVVYQALFAAAYTLAWWQCFRVDVERRAESSRMFSIRLVIVGAVALDLFAMVLILMTGGTTMTLAGSEISVRGLQNPLLVMWALLLIWALARWRLRVQFRPPPAETFWRSAQALTIAAAVFAVLSLPLIMQAFRLAASGRYVSQVYFWRSAPRGIDALSFAIGSPFHPVLGGAVTLLYRTLGIDRIEAVGWLGIVPLLVLVTGKGKWLDEGEARCWKIVLVVFVVWALGPFLTACGYDLGLPLPEALARFVPLVSNARMPGRAMVGVYLALGVLMSLRLAAREGFWKQPAAQWALIGLLALDYLNAPVPLTALEEPVVYQRLASIDDEGPVIDVPFGIGDGLSAGFGNQDRRILYYATIHGHPLVGGFIGRMPPEAAQAYLAMPIVGNVLRLSSGQPAVEEEVVPVVPFRYLVLDTVLASPELVAYVHSKLDVDLLESAEGRELYAVQGVKPPNLTASK